MEKLRALTGFAFGLIVYALVLPVAVVAIWLIALLSLGSDDPLMKRGE